MVRRNFPQDMTLERRGLAVVDWQPMTLLGKSIVMILEAIKNSLTMKTEYKQTETWKTWQKSLLSNFPPDSPQGMVLFTLLLAAKSSTGLEKFNDSDILPDQYKLSNELKKAIKKVYAVMTQRKEEWVILSVMFSYLVGSKGFCDFYWQLLKAGKPIINFLPRPVLDPLFSTPFKGDIDHTDNLKKIGYESIPDAIKYLNGKEVETISLWKLSDKELRINQIRQCSEIKKGFDDKDYFKTKIKFIEMSEIVPVPIVRFFYVGKGKISAVFFFPTRFFNEENAEKFKKLMPYYYVAEGFLRGFDEVIESPIFAYVLEDERFEDLIEFGQFCEEKRRPLKFHKGQMFEVYIEDYFIKPKNGFLGLINENLQKLEIPLKITE